MSSLIIFGGGLTPPKRTHFSVLFDRTLDGLGLNNTKVALIVRSTQDVISRYRRGKRNPSWGTQRNMADLLGLPKEYFEEGFDTDSIDLIAMRRAREAGSVPTAATGHGKGVPTALDGPQGHDTEGDLLRDHLAAIRRHVGALEALLLNGYSRAVMVPVVTLPSPATVADAPKHAAAALTRTSGETPAQPAAKSARRAKRA